MDSPNPNGVYTVNPYSGGIKENYTGYEIDTEEYFQPTPGNGGGILINPDWNPNTPVTTSAGKINWWKVFISILNEIPGGGIIVALINGKGVPPGIDPEELLEVQNFINQIFLPFIRTITAQANVIVKTGTATVENLNVLNKTLNQLCVIKSYFSHNDNTTFLSDQSLNYRFDLIATVIDNVEKTIVDKIKLLFPNTIIKTGVVNISGLNFQPLITQPLTTAFQCNSYVITTRTEVQNTSHQTVVPQDIKNPVATTTANVHNATVIPDDKKSLQNWLLIGGAAAVVLYIFSGKKDKK